MVAVVTCSIKSGRDSTCGAFVHVARMSASHHYRHWGASHERRWLGDVTYGRHRWQARVLLFIKLSWSFARCSGEYDEPARPLTVGSRPLHWWRSQIPLLRVLAPVDVAWSTHACFYPTVVSQSMAHQVEPGAEQPSQPPVRIVLDSDRRCVRCRTTSRSLATA